MDNELANELINLSFNQIMRIEDKDKQQRLESLYRNYCYAYLFGALELFNKKKLNFRFSQNNRYLTVRQIIDEILSFAFLNNISKEEVKKAMIDFNTKILENRKKWGKKK